MVLKVSCFLVCVLSATFQHLIFAAFYLLVVYSLLVFFFLCSIRAAFNNEPCCNIWFVLIFITYSAVCYFLWVSVCSMVLNSEIIAKWCAVEKYEQKRRKEKKRRQKILTWIRGILLLISAFQKSLRKVMERSATSLACWIFMLMMANIK